MNEKNIQLYRDASGRAPFKEWYKALKDNRSKIKVDVQVTRLACGNPGKAKSVGSGVMELKIDFGPGYRIYYGQEGETLILLLIGGDKNTQKTDIAKAKEYWAAYKALRKETL